MNLMVEIINLWKYINYSFDISDVMKFFGVVMELIMIIIGEDSMLYVFLFFW